VSRPRSQQAPVRVWPEVSVPINLGAPQALNPTGGARNGFLSEAFPTDKDTRHNYTLNYNWIMGPYQKTAANVLEVSLPDS